MNGGAETLYPGAWMSTHSIAQEIVIQTFLSLVHIYLGCLFDSACHGLPFVFPHYSFLPISLLACADSPSQ